MNAEQAKKLRAPFKPEQIGKLPKAGIMLDYVGHAATTDRLLQVDPTWTWEPMAYGPNGEPLMTNGGMWIKLTVCGVTRPGFGDGKTPKEIIGDAIRNAAMRFGVALDLWAKEDLHVSDGEPKPVAPAGSVQRKPIPTAQGHAAAPSPSEEDKLIATLRDLTKKLGAWEATEKSVEDHRTGDPVAFKAWLRRCIGAAQKNLEEKKQRAESAFQPPEGVKAA